MDDSISIRKAKQALISRYSGEPWYRGAGIEPGNGDLRLRLNVAPGHAAGLPTEFMGLSLNVVEIEGYSLRPEA